LSHTNWKDKTKDGLVVHQGVTVEGLAVSVEGTETEPKAAWVRVDLVVGAGWGPVVHQAGVA
jgi:hypothetical protein